jgi:hypothetical protein
MGEKYAKKNGNCTSSQYYKAIIFLASVSHVNYNTAAIIFVFHTAQCCHKFLVKKMHKLYEYMQ